MSGKDKHYWSQLRSALTAGQWSSQIPAKTPNGTPLSWSELFRKFNKHCIGYKDVAEVASQTHALALLIAASSKDQDVDRPPKTGEFVLELDDECMVAEERIAEAIAGYEILKKLESANFDTLNFALAYYAYALGNPSECLSHLQKVPDVSHITEHIPVAGTSRSTTMSLQVPGGDAPSISSVGGSAASESASNVPVSDGRAWAMTESFRSICLQGMSNEKLFPSEPDKALAVYSTALPLLSMTESEFVSNASPIGASGKLNFASFTRFRELWRWVETIIWRAVTVGARICDINREDTHNVLWSWLAHYSTCSAYWPSNFRTAHRCTISVLYIRALVLRNGSPLPPADISKPPPWLHTARSVIQEYRAILSVCTKFPRAGEHNVKVEEFVDLCVAVWEASGAIGDYAGWVIDVLWWATRMTFNSFRIMRHMTRLLHVSGDTALAKRTLKLYVQIVSKAWQASDCTISDDTDSNRDWVETLVAGSRMLCKSASISQDGIEDAREAGRLIDLARTRLDTNHFDLVAAVDLAEGVWNSVMALKERDPHSRPKRLADAHELFLKATETHSTPAGHYHLALSYARPGPSYDLEKALLSSGLAVEGDPKEIRYWHLIGLLLAASEQWKAAEEIFERGAEIGEPAAEDELLNGGSNNSELLTDGRAIDGLPSVDGATHPVLKRASMPPPIYLLDQPGMPPAADLLLPAADHAAPSRQELFEYSLQLRMTQVALVEHVEGAEGAETKWLDVFSWIAERRGLAAVAAEEPQPTGMNNLKSPSELVLSVSRSSHDKGPQEPPQQPQIITSPPEDDTLPLPMPIPITISPATPEEVSRGFPAEPRPTEKILEEKVNGQVNGSRGRSLSIDRGDTSKSKKVQQMLKNRVNKGQARISTISKRIGSGVVRPGHLRRSNSTPDFHAVLRPTSYQASSIHSRPNMGSLIRRNSITPSISPPPPPPTLPAAQTKWSHRTARETRLESDLWLMSAATFRRLGKIEQAKGSVQEAEVKDEGNPAVWVQLGLYYVALGHMQHAIEAFQKALFIDPDDVSASVHLCRLYLTPEGSSRTAEDEVDPNNVDLVAGMLGHLTRGAGWDVPEVWYFLAKAYGMQDRKDKERECLTLALQLSERRGVREVASAVGWCI
ncbi:hypothetical protein R3P38DRAFT_2899579 [Favolaschia claudopus]|uniref:TPR-like protein n=1 Tax=Favolaschia claudopus TaxID=2862362 RepID=A0AAW0CI48_9AGAR